jgi:lipopolysaccharide export LptBFGC system permease protein LptF/predicted RNA-binding Zn-ribbon protein involved in translation (DUF1610 family)
MNGNRQSKGPWTHRFLVLLLTVLLTLLVFWLLGFALSDIGSLRGPSYEETEKKFLSESLIDESRAIEKQLRESNRKMQEQKERQTLLRDSTSGFQRTMNQLLEMQRLNAERGMTLPAAQQNALAESVELFLANQKQDQALTEDIAKRMEEQGALEEKKQAIEEQLAAQREAAQKEFERLERKHSVKLAFLKLLLLLPLLGGVLALFIKKRGGLYAPIVYAAGIAVLWRTILVIHEHFPTRYFKYVVLGAAIAVVVYGLVWLLRMMRFPKASWLLKQYREAYERFFCPVCEYPIRRGPMRFMGWTRRTARRLVPPAAASQGEEVEYSCPACGSRLYEKCSSCGHVRHSLLPFCEHCAAEKALGSLPQS